MRGYIFLFAAVLFCFMGCEVIQENDLKIPDSGNTIVSFSVADAGTKALNPDETLFKDLNFFIFNANGVLEYKRFTAQTSLNEKISLNLVRNCEYTIYACANLGYELKMNDITALAEHRHYIAYPDDYVYGMVMSCIMKFKAGEEEEVVVPLQRLFSKISIVMNWGELDEGVDIKVRSVQVGGCPKYVTPFSENSIINNDDFFPAGFTRSDMEAEPLNVKNPDGKSNEICLYMLENMHGELLPGNESEHDKYFPAGDARAEYCSYVEICMEYMSDDIYSIPGEYLIYRFYPGLSPSNFDVCRNVDYRIVITPSGDGIGADNWRTDQSALTEYIESISLNYSSYSMNYAGQEVLLNTYILPETALPDCVSWYSSNDAVASVSQSGKVTARGEGNCRVVCCATDGSDAYSECNINVAFSSYYMRISPGNFIRCKKGDDVTISCEYFPPNAEFDIGLEELEYDKARGIYDYTIRADGRSVVLHTKERGSGLLYIEAGEPINHAEMIVLVVD